MINVLINADDFGSSSDVNTAIDLCFRNNWIDRTTIMVNMSEFKSAVQLCQNGGYCGKVGLHINLIEGVPLTDKIKHTVFCDDGKFNGKALKVTKNRFFLNRYTKNAIYEEIDAQMKEYLSAGFVLMHVDSHEHTHTNWSVLPILLKCAKENGFYSIRLSRNIPKKEISFTYRVYKYFINKLISSFNKKSGHQNHYFGSQDDVTKILDEVGNVEMMVHPTMKDGAVVDVFNQQTIEEWLNKNMLL